MSADQGDEDIEVINLADVNPSWVQNVVDDLAHSSPAKQITVGGVSGWCAGYVTAKVGRAAALALGGSLLLLQIAHQQQYININWGKVRRTVDRARRQVENNTNTALPAFARNAGRLFRDHVYLAGGFAGGFLLGVAS